MKICKLDPNCKCEEYFSNIEEVERDNVPLKRNEGALEEVIYKTFAETFIPQSSYVWQRKYLKRKCIEDMIKKNEE